MTSPKFEYGVAWLSKHDGRDWEPLNWFTSLRQARDERRRLLEVLSPATEIPFNFKLVRRLIAGQTEEVKHGRKPRVASKNGARTRNRSTESS